MQVLHLAEGPLSLIQPTEPVVPDFEILVQSPSSRQCFAISALPLLDLARATDGRPDERVNA